LKKYMETYGVILLPVCLCVPHPYAWKMECCSIK
jgi:hypothetical protein